jgi:nucleoside-diphosphate-sugar epimerase
VRVFVAGATGAVGRPLVVRLIRAGHEVVGMTRSHDRAQWLTKVGARPAVGNAFNADWLREAVDEARPEVVIDELTDLPQRIGLRGMRRFYRGQIPLRTVGSGNLLEAARAAGVRRVISQSVAFIYAPDGGGLKAETDRAWSDAPAPFGAALGGAAEHDELVVRSTEFEGVVLRYGVFYGPGTHFAPGNGIHRDVRRRRLPIVGEGRSIWSFVHVQDAAMATVNALQHGEAGIYNVVDDEPAPTREWIPEYAAIIGAPPPRTVPRWLSRVFAGPAMTAWSTEFPGASNEKAKRELNWRPGYSSWRQGFRDGLDAIEEDET